MTNEAPWSVKGVDSETRKQLKEIAQETGVTLGELIGALVSQQAQGGKKLKSPLKAETKKLDTALDEEVKTTRRKRTTTRKSAAKTTTRKTATKTTAKKAARAKQHQKKRQHAVKQQRLKKHHQNHLLFLKAFLIKQRCHVQNLHVALRKPLLL